MAGTNELPETAGADERGRPWRLCVAPMMDWTDRHCRFFHRLLSPNARLYTEMVTAPAVLHGDRERLLGFDPSEHPVALQLGGSEPHELAAAARVGESQGYEEINLNVGCPSDRVQSGRFGACLMREPALVADCIAAMRAAVSVPVTVKCRLGVDEQDEYEDLERFVETVRATGCRVFVVHARKAWLEGLSPKENREIPPLNYARVYRLKREFPELTIVINGGIASVADVHEHLEHVDGVMLGRVAYHDPWLIADPANGREAVVRRMAGYARRHLPLRQVTRHMLGLYHGMPRARLWRRMLSDSARLARNRPELLLEALEAVDAAAAMDV